jgi:hypothetical protein
MLGLDQCRDEIRCLGFDRGQEWVLLGLSGHNALPNPSVSQSAAWADYLIFDIQLDDRKDRQRITPCHVSAVASLMIALVRVGLCRGDLQLFQGDVGKHTSQAPPASLEFDAGAFRARAQGCTVKAGGAVG